MKRESLTVLVAEDSPDDQLFLRLAFKECCPRHVVLQMTSSGNEAIDYLKGQGHYGDRAAYPYPTFLLTDLKMPNGDGFSILEFLKNTPGSLILPTVVLSASTDSHDIKTAYELGASAFLSKPNTPSELTELMGKLIAFWMCCEVPEANVEGEQLSTAGAGKLGHRFQ